MEVTPSNGGKRQDRVKELLKKQVESEARIEFWGEIVRLKVGTRELENMGESLQEKFRSVKMKGGNGERILVENGSILKLRDEKMHRREIYLKAEMEKSHWRKELESGWKFKRKMSLIKQAVNKHKRNERKRLNKKLKHLVKIRNETKEKELEACPQELDNYKEAIVYNKDLFNKLSKENVIVDSIGGIMLSDDEKEVLKLHPKFGVMERLDSTGMEIEAEMGAAKYRYNIIKEDEVMYEEDYGDGVIDDNDAPKDKKRRLLDKEEEEMMEQMEMLEAEERQVFDPVSLTFDYSKKKATDLKENKSVKLPSPNTPHTESSIEILKNKMMEAFRDYRDKNCNKKGEQKTNLTRSEKAGLESLLKRIDKGEIVALKTDKSGKMTVMRMEDYMELGLKKSEKDEEIPFHEVKTRQKRINDTTRYWIKILAICRESLNPK